MERASHSQQDLEDGETLEEAENYSENHQTSSEFRQKSHSVPFHSQESSHKNHGNHSESQSAFGTAFPNQDLKAEFSRLVKDLDDPEEQQKWLSEWSDLDFESQEKLIEDLTNLIALQEREKIKNRRHREGDHETRSTKKRGTEEQFVQTDTRFSKRRQSNGTTTNSNYHQRPREFSSRRGRAEDLKPWERNREGSHYYKNNSFHSSHYRQSSHSSSHREIPVDMAGSLKWSQLVQDLLGITRKPDVDQRPPPPPKHMVRAALLSPEFSHQITMLLEKNGLEPAKIVSSSSSASSSTASTNSSVTSSPSLTSYLKLRRAPHPTSIESYEQMYDRVFGVPQISSNADLHTRMQHPHNQNARTPTH